jgi:hypothetical protein
MLYALGHNYFLLEYLCGIIVRKNVTYLGRYFDIEEELTEFADDYLYTMIDVLKAFKVLRQATRFDASLLGAYYNEDFDQFSETLTRTFGNCRFSQMYRALYTIKVLGTHNFIWAVACLSNMGPQGAVEQGCITINCN